MVQMRVAAAIGVAVAAIAAPVAHAQTAEPKPRAVVELFTSQGCSSCPPADRLMAEFARDPTMVVLTLPVDYWDYLGWKDTLAHSAFTFRQRAYSGMRGDRQVYTPQAVINGIAHAVGSDRAQIEKMIGLTNGANGVLMSEIRISAGPGGLSVQCPDRAMDAGPAHLWVMPFARERSVQIGRGENSGRSVTYVNVVRGLSRIGECRGPAASVPVPPASLAADADGVVVLMQGGTEKKPAQILAVARRFGL